jgi:regulator of sigma E protease
MSSVFLIKALQLLLSLAILVVLHELGHFIPAKLFKTKVEKFYLFFDWPFSLFKKKIGDTEYGIGVLPLGGYVKIAGMIDESMDTEHLNKEPEPWEFRSKPAWQRLIIMLGGITVNIFLGFAIYAMVAFVWGKTVVTNENLPNGFEVAEVMKPFGFQDGDKILEFNGEGLEDIRNINKYLFLRDVSQVRVEHLNGKQENISVPDDIGTVMFKNDAIRAFNPYWFPAILDSIVPNSPAYNAGLLKGDRIIKVNGNDVVKWEEFTKQVIANTSKNIDIDIKRGNEIISNTIPLNENNQIGVSRLQSINLTPTILEYSFIESIYDGYDRAYWELLDYVGQFKYVFTKKGASQLGGFGAIGNLFPAEWNWKVFWERTALLSIILAFMNALPIPALDGGHVMFLMYEVVTGSKPNDKFMEYAQITGFFFLLALVFYANGNDVVRYFFS